jgi:hypothetical protein
LNSRPHDHAQIGMLGSRHSVVGQRGGLPIICSSVEWRGWRFRAQIIQFCAFSDLRATDLARRLLTTRYLLA